MGRLPFSSSSQSFYNLSKPGNYQEIIFQDVDLRPYNNVEYAEPVEYGHRMKGGGFKKGAHMLEVSLQEMDRKLPDYLRAWLADFLNTHDLV